MVISKRALANKYNCKVKTINNHLKWLNIDYLNASEEEIKAINEDLTKYKQNKAVQEKLNNTWWHYYVNDKHFMSKNPLNTFKAEVRASERIIKEIKEDESLKPYLKTYERKKRESLAMLKKEEKIKQWYLDNKARLNKDNIYMNY